MMRKLFTLCLVQLFVFTTQAQIPAAKQADTAGRPILFTTWMESMPEYPGGQKKLQQFITPRTHFPPGTEDISGKVVLQFEVDMEGKLSNIIVKRSLHPALDSVAVSIIRAMPPWKPARHNDNPVKCSYTLPIFFRPY